MKLTFLGTRGNIEARTEAHRCHTSLMVSYYDTDVMIDAGEDWRGRLDGLGADAIVVTHAHPDHAWGLQEGAPCPVWATEETWEDIGDYPVERAGTVEPRRPFEVGDIEFEAFAVAHSTRAPAVGYRISAGEVTIFYVPDVVYIEQREKALAGCKLYVGDGATLGESFVRKPGDQVIGHTPVRTQLTWCQKFDVPRAIITHCGSEIVEGDPDAIDARLAEMADERGVRAEIAVDGQEVVLR